MSEQMPCHRRHTIERWTVDCRDGGTLVTFTMDGGYCPTCGAKLERNGTVKPMVEQVTSESVRRTRLWQALTMRTSNSDSDAMWHLYLIDSTGKLTDAGRTIHAALAARPAK